jgi:hypothetical protein
MRLLGTKMNFFVIQGINLKRKIAWQPIITEVKLPGARSTTLATVQIKCA